MTTKIGIISDVHATAAPVKEALEIFEKQGVDEIYCAGDIAGYGVELKETIQLLKSCDAISILGNHDLWYIEKPTEEQETESVDYLKTLPIKHQATIENKTVYMVHGSPPVSQMDGIKLFDQDGKLMLDNKDYWHTQLSEFDYDVLIVGHTHQVYAESIGDMLVVNSGSTKFNHCCVVLELPDMKVDFYPLSNKGISKIWNWSHVFGNKHK